MYDQLRNSVNTESGSAALALLGREHNFPCPSRTSLAGGCRAILTMQAPGGSYRPAMRCSGQHGSVEESREYALVTCRVRGEEAAR
jgi:hypothetical protein